MTLDLGTVLLVMVFTTFVLAIAVLVADWRTAARNSLGLWGWGLLVHGLIYPTFALRMIDLTTLSVVLSNSCTALNIALHSWAIVRFRRCAAEPGAAVPPAVPQAVRLAVWVPVGMTPVIALLFTTAHPVRNFLLGIVFAWQSAWLLFEVVRQSGSFAAERGRLLLTLGSALLLLIFLARAVASTQTGFWISTMGVPPLMQALSYLGGLAVVLFNTLGYVLMQKERAVWLQHEQATHDPLTGIFNRRALLNELERAIAQARRSDQPLALLMIDIDFFKKVNDTWGHQVGDVVLRSVAQRIAGRLRQADLLARFGGEEFMVLLPATDERGALILAEDIRRTIEATPMMVRDQAIAITVSVGVHTRVPEAGDDVADRMVSLCDLALYDAKRRGRNRVEVARRA